MTEWSSDEERIGLLPRDPALPGSLASLRELTCTQIAHSFVWTMRLSLPGCAAGDGDLSDWNGQPVSLDSIRLKKAVLLYFGA